MTTRGTLHHLELWVADLETSRASLGWLLEALGYHESRTWSTGSSWAMGASYVVVESGSDVQGVRHERRHPGMNHLAFYAGSRSEVEHLAQASREHGWAILFPDRHPHAGGPDHYAAYLEDAAGFEVELVASP